MVLSKRNNEKQKKIFSEEDMELLLDISDRFEVTSGNNKPSSSKSKIPSFFFMTCVSIMEMFERHIDDAKILDSINEKLGRINIWGNSNRLGEYAKNEVEKMIKLCEKKGHRNLNPTDLLYWKINFEYDFNEFINWQINILERMDDIVKNGEDYQQDKQDESVYLDYLMQQCYREDEEIQLDLSILRQKMQKIQRGIEIESCLNYIKEIRTWVFIKYKKKLSIIEKQRKKGIKTYEKIIKRKNAKRGVILARIYTALSDCKSNMDIEERKLDIGDLIKKRDRYEKICRNKIESLKQKEFSGDQFTIRMDSIELYNEAVIDIGDPCLRHVSVNLREKNTRKYTID